MFVPPRYRDPKRLMKGVLELLEIEKAGLCKLFNDPPLDDPAHIRRSTFLTATASVIHHPHNDRAVGSLYRASLSLRDYIWRLPLQRARLDVEVKGCKIHDMTRTQK